MFQATRCRLALWYTTVTAVLLLFFATGVYLYVRNTLIDRVDDTLKHVVEVVERSLIIQPVESSDFPYRINIEASFRNNADAAAEDDRIDLEWFSPNGELLWSTLSEQLDVPLHPSPFGETVSVDAERLLRQVTKRIEEGRYVLGYLRVSHPWFEVTKPIRQLVVDLSTGTVLMVASTAAIGWWLSGLAMAPVRESYQRLKQFTADASHELRNPIATIQTNVQVALADPELDSPWQRRQLKVVERLTQRLGRLVNDLLFLARVDSGMAQTQWQSVPLDALLMEVIEEQQLSAAEKGIFLSLHLRDDLTVVETDSEFEQEEAFTLRGDWNQLARLFTNLVSNAVHYTPVVSQNSEAVSVQVELQRLERHSNARGRSSQPHLQVRVCDRGIGIPESALPHIFDRFYRADPARSHDTETGSGLGLAIAKAIVDNHRGQIQVESIPKQGTTVTVTLPVTG